MSVLLMDGAMMVAGLSQGGGAVARVFVSHSGTDAGVAAELHQWLIEDGHEVFLDRDTRDGIAIGEEWQLLLHERLRWADAVVCVLTSAYLQSPWCTAEVGIAQSRGTRLLPIRVEPGISHPLLASMHTADLSDDLDVRAKLREALRRLDATGGGSWPASRSPFPGLRAFDTNMHQVFFGRTRETEQFATLLRSPAERAEGALLVVVGSSGCGKSSLIRAGLLPVMACEPDWLTVPAIVPGAQPAGALARELAVVAHQIGLKWSTAYVRRQLDNDSLADLANDLLMAGTGPRRQHLLIAVDQFEELLTQAMASERARFARLLRSALAGPVQVVASLRSEFVGHMLSNSELTSFPVRIHPLLPLGREGLRAVVEGPAKLAGIGLDEELVTRLVADTDNGEALPLLAYMLAQLAEGVERGGRLSIDRYNELGGVRGALAVQADKALADAISATGRTRKDVIKGLLQLVTVDEQDQPVRWRVRRDTLSPDVSAELGAFIDRRLLTTDLVDGHVVVGFAHEAFMSAWRPLAEVVTVGTFTTEWTSRLIEQAEFALTAAAAASGRGRDQVILDLMQLVNFNGYGGPTRMQVRRCELPEPVVRVLAVFAERQLVTSDVEDDEVLFGLTHEAMLRRWPPLAEAIHSRRKSLFSRDNIEEAANHWAREGRPPYKLWQGTQLSEALTSVSARLRVLRRPDLNEIVDKDLAPYERQWYRRHLWRRIVITDRARLSPTARVFLVKSIRLDWRRRRRPLAIFLGALALAIIGITLASVITQLSERMENIGRLAVARGLIVRADETFAANSQVALRLAEAAYHIYPTSETQAELVRILTITEGGRRESPLGLPIERACSLTGRGLNVDEWNQFVPGLPYEDSCPE